MVIMLHRHADGMVVYDGDHFSQVIGKETVEEHFVTVVQRCEVDVFADHIRQHFVLKIGTF